MSFPVPGKQASAATPDTLEAKRLHRIGVGGLVGVALLGLLVFVTTSPREQPDAAPAPEGAALQLPDGTIGAAFGPDGRLWRWEGVHQNHYTEAQATAELIHAFSEEQPTLRQSRVALFGPGDWVWVVMGPGDLLLGTDGQRVERREALPAFDDFRAFTGSPPGVAAFDENTPTNRVFRGNAYFVDRAGVHRFDGEAWSYQQLVDENPRATNWTSVVLLPVPAERSRAEASVPGAEAAAELRAAAWYNLEAPYQLKFYRWAEDEWQTLESPAGLTKPKAARRHLDGLTGVAATPEAFWLSNERGSLFRLPVSGDRVAPEARGWEDLAVHDFGPYRFQNVALLYQAPDGRIFLTANGVQDARSDRDRSMGLALLWREPDSSQYRALRTRAIHVGRVTHAESLQAVGQDRLWLYSRENAPIRLIDLENGQVLHQLEPAGINGLQTAHPDGRVALQSLGPAIGIRGGNRRVPRLVDPAQPEAKPTTAYPESLRLKGNRQSDIRLSPTGELWSAAPDGQWHRLDTDGWREVEALTAFKKLTFKVEAISPGDAVVGTTGIPGADRGYGWVGLTPGRSPSAALPWDVFVAQNDRYLKHYFAGQALRHNRAVGRNGWVWDYNAPSSGLLEDLQLNVYVGQPRGWIDLGPAVADLLGPIDDWPSHIQVLGAGDVVAIIEENRGRHVVVVRLGWSPQSPDHVDLRVEHIQGQGRFGRGASGSRPPILSADGVLRLPGQRYREAGSEGQTTQSFEPGELHIAPNGTWSTHRAPGKLVFVDRQGRSYYHALPGRTSGWFAVCSPDRRSTEYFLVPHAGQRLVMGQTEDDTVWVWHHDRCTAVLPPERRGDGWAVGPSVRVGGVDGRLDLVRWSPAGFFVLDFNAFDFGSTPTSDDASPPAVGILRPTLPD